MARLLGLVRDAEGRLLRVKRGRQKYLLRFTSAEVVATHADHVDWSIGYDLVAYESRRKVRASRQAARRAHRRKLKRD